MTDRRTAVSPRAAPRRARTWPPAAALVVSAAALVPWVAQAQAPACNQQEEAAADCSGVPDHQRLTQALREVVAPGDPEANGGLGNHMWAVVVNRAGVICAVSRSGEAYGEQWPGSRMIAAEKAFTANAFSLPGFALSTANLYWPSQPENSLYALATSNPVHEEALYVGDASSWGTADDPVVERRVGGTVVFGGGLALYDQEGQLVGGLGVSGDESCTDHIVAWKLRYTINLDNVPDGVSDAGDDNIIHDLSVDPATGRMESTSGYGHPTCSPTAARIARNLHDELPAGPEE
jgi:uncharacterized protein GlcG (DUF336 family)